jgi:hypothetical protein
LPAFLLPLALIASSAIAISPSIAEEVKKNQKAQQLTGLGADVRIAQQSERLTGTGSLLTATSPNNNPAVRMARHQNSNQWFIPVIVLGALFLTFVIVSKRGK